MKPVVKWRQQFTVDLPAPLPGCIWLHACSVGEVGSVAPLMCQLCQRGDRVHLTVVTRTGFAHAQRLLAEQIAAGVLFVSYLPWDLPGLMMRLLHRVQPKALLLTETEFWPGMLAACRRQRVKVIGINTRISDRSFPRYLASRWLWQRWLAPVSLFLAQSPADGDRLQALGIPAEKVHCLGNLKTAVTAPKVDAQGLRQRVDSSTQRPILLVASSHADEEQAVLQHWRQWEQIAPTLLAVVVPRHPERFDAAVEACQGLGLATCRWSESRPVRADESVLVVDAMGVLGGLFTIADLVVVGGSVADCGGHNPLEAAVCGRGVITGPHIQNFRSVMQALQRAGGAVVTENPQELAAAVLRFLQHPDELRQLHGQAALWMQQQGDVLGAVLAAVDHALGVVNK